eukprot:2468976-Prymnesium_polylepis.1
MQRNNDFLQHRPGFDPGWRTRQMKEAGVGEDAVEASLRQVEGRQILFPHLAAGELARHPAEGGHAVEPGRAMAELCEGDEVTAGGAAHIEDVERTLERCQRPQQRVDVLQHIVVHVARRIPFCDRAVVIERRAARLAHVVAACAHESSTGGGRAGSSGGALQRRRDDEDHRTWTLHA